jgi:hypothetical protein
MHVMIERRDDGLNRDNSFTCRIMHSKQRHKNVLYRIVVKTLMYGGFYLNSLCYFKRDASLSDSDVGRYVTVRNLLDCILNSLPVFVGRWEFQMNAKNFVSENKQIFKDSKINNANLT